MQSVFHYLSTVRKRNVYIPDQLFWGIDVCIDLFESQALPPHTLIKEVYLISLTTQLRSLALSTRKEWL